MSMMAEEALALEPAIPFPPLPAAPALPVGTKIPEIWSMRLSLLGAALAVPALAFLLWPSIAARSPAHVVSFSLYGFGLLSMFLASAKYHHEAGRPRVLTKCLDYGAIGMMIAGNFTPYCAILLRTPTAYAILGVVWALALGAAAVRIARPKMSKWVFVSIFLGMGWLAMILTMPLVRALGPGGSWLTLAGGVIYTAGTLFFNGYQGDVEPPGFGQHDIWHIFIIAAAGTHFVVLYLYMLPVR